MTCLTASRVLLILLILVPGPALSDNPKTLSWEELMPDGWNPDSVFDHLTDEEFTNLSDEEYEVLQRQAQKIIDQAPTVASLHGQRVRLPGFVLPLDYEDAQLREFLLVPYFGACIHVPPPPANQIVYATLNTEFFTNELYEPVWVTGILEVDSKQTQLGESGYTQSLDVLTGYRMTVDEIQPYEE